MKKIIRKNSALFWIWDRVYGQKRNIVLLILGNILFAITIVVFSLGCQGLIDGAVASDVEILIKYALVLFGIILLRLLLRLSVNSLNEYLKAKITNQIRQDTLHQLLKKDYASLCKYHSGELVNRMFSDTQVVVTGILEILPPLANMCTRMIGAVGILMSMDSRFTMVFLVAGCTAFIITRFFRKKIKELHKKVQEKEGKVHAFLQETLENMRLIKASDLEVKMENQAESCQAEHMKAQLHRRTYSITSNAGMNFIFQMGYLYALVWGGLKISSHAMSYGTLTAILQLVGQIQTPFSSMSGVLQKLYGMLSSAERLEELFNLEDEKGEDLVNTYHEFQEMQLRNLNFSYDRMDVLKDVNFTVKSGDFIALTGLSGGGKSTLFLLMLGIYQPLEGSIQFQFENGVEAAGKRTRKLFAYVPQGNTLFSGTLRENIAMFAENSTEEQIWHAAEVACVKEFIAEQPEGLDTVIGERGVGLSEGQAQRIAVARAILSGAPILLLDEATSALDGETEKRLLENIAALKNKTCIIVTHRKAALAICNRCLNLENGKIEER